MTQRIGQWIYNELVKRNVRIDLGCVIRDEDIRENKARLADILWNMSDKEFREIMKKYQEENGPRCEKCGVLLDENNIAMISTFGEKEKTQCKRCYWSN